MTDVDRLLNALQQQQERYDTMVAVMEEQKSLLGARDVDALMVLVDRKRALLSEIDELEKQVVEVRGGWEETRETLGETSRRRVEEAIERKRVVLERLVNLENEGLELMQQRRSAAADELKALVKKKRARTAYLGNGRR